MGAGVGFQPAQLLAQLPPWLQLLVAAAILVGPLWVGVAKAVGGWRSWRVSLRQQDEAVIRDTTRQLIETLRAEIKRAEEQVDRARAVIGQYVTEIELLRAARWTMSSDLSELHDAALAARTMVHELERELGRPPTPFRPLPGPPGLARGPPPIPA